LDPDPQAYIKDEFFVQNLRKNTKGQEKCDAQFSHDPKEIEIRNTTFRALFYHTSSECTDFGFTYILQSRGNPSAVIDIWMI